MESRRHAHAGESVFVGGPTCGREVGRPPRDAGRDPELVDPALPVAAVVRALGADGDGPLAFAVEMKITAATRLLVAAADCEALHSQLPPTAPGPAADSETAPAPNATSAEKPNPQLHPEKCNLGKLNHNYVAMCMVRTIHWAP